MSAPDLTLNDARREINRARAQARRLLRWTDPTADSAQLAAKQALGRAAHHQQVVVERTTGILESEAYCA